MTIKILCFQAQTALQSRHGITTKRSHIHEILAALFGYGSHAALTAQAIYAQTDGASQGVNGELDMATARAQQCGYTTEESQLIGQAIWEAAEANRLVVTSLDDVLSLLQDNDQFRLAPNRDFDDSSLYEDEELDREHDGNKREVRGEESVEFQLDLSSTVLMESLEAAAARGSADAHLALALLVGETDGEIDDDTQPGLEGSFWYDQLQAGRELTGVELEWARAHERSRTQSNQYLHHIRLAAEGGNIEAAVRLAEAERSAHSFGLAMKMVTPVQAYRLAEVAAELGRDSDATDLLRMAARAGDTEAMSELAHRVRDAKEAWTWVYLAALFGRDLQRVEAIHEDGSPYDDDVGGPAYPVGGIDLPQLSPVDEAGAREAAQRLYERAAAALTA